MNLDELQITNETLEDDSYIEWIYVIDVKSLLIHVIDNRGEYGRNLHIGGLPLRGNEPNFQHLECGVDYSRCACLASAHFSEVDPVGPLGRMSTKQFLGMKPVGAMSDAIAVIVGGHRYEWDGRAFTEGGFVFSYPKLDTRIPNALHAELEIDGKRNKFQLVS